MIDKLMSKRIIIFLLISSISTYTLLSYILLFRDKRALAIIPNFYPDLQNFLVSTRVFLLSHNLNTIPTLIFLIIGIVSFFAYFSSLKTKINLKTTVVVATLLQIISLMAYPILETDIFSYMAADRVFTVFHQNVWKVAPIVFKSDPFFGLADWTELTRIYGGVNQFFYNFASYIGGNSLVLNILSYKGLVLIFTFLSMFMVYKITQEFFPKKEAFALRMIFWNPLFVLEIVGAGHNDIPMLFFMLTGYYLYLKKQIILAGIALGLAVQTKFIAVVMFPFLLMDLLFNRKLKEFIYFGVAFSVVVFLIFSLMQINPIVFIQRVLFNAGVYWQGLPSLVYKFYEHKTPIFLLGFGLSNILLLTYQYAKKANPILIYCASVFLYLTFFAGAYWNWYVLWAFMFVPFIKQNPLTKALLTLTFTSILAYPLYWISLRFGYQNIFWQFAFYVWIFVIPLIVLFYARGKPKFLELTGS